MKGGLIRDLVVGEGRLILQILVIEEETLLVCRNAFHVLELGLDIVNGVRRLDIEWDNQASESFHKDLHTW